MGSDNAKKAQTMKLSPLALAIIGILLISHLPKGDNVNSNNTQSYAQPVTSQTHVTGSIPCPVSAPCPASPPSPISVVANAPSSASSSSKVSKFYEPTRPYQITSESPNDRFSRIGPAARQMGQEYLEAIKSQDKVRWGGLQVGF